MVDNQAFGRAVRLRRLYRHGGARLLVVPMDHPVSDGPITATAGVGPLVQRLAEHDVDAVVLHKGALRHIDHQAFASLSLIVHLSASTMHAPDPDAKYLVASVEEALRLGADAVSVHVNIGAEGERQQVADLAAVSEACDRWNMPLMAMMYPRGPRITDPRDPVLVAHAAVLAAELGADLVKTPYAGGAAEMTDVVRCCPIPVLVAGGAPTASPAEFLSHVDEVLASPVAGLAAGRNIFASADPGTLAQLVADRVHSPMIIAPPRELAPAGR
ncbi:MAG TPA: 2-amino-3,7-dideoxy-D-threo-hept-6-ulosonate synthase [Pseudonocardiaceae bacterium]|nr:2-amino-3,7-dideoxy-D-threo-hept-6-ulosonate synthase [Pseudonocardiaceae bacterium]